MAGKRYYLLGYDRGSEGTLFSAEMDLGADNAPKRVSTDLCWQEDNGGSVEFITYLDPSGLLRVLSNRPRVQQKNNRKTHQHSLIIDGAKYTSETRLHDTQLSRYGFSGNLSVAHLLLCQPKVRADQDSGEVYCLGVDVIFGSGQDLSDYMAALYPRRVPLAA